MPEFLDRSRGRILYLVMSCVRGLDFRSRRSRLARSLPVTCQVGGQNPFGVQPCGVPSGAFDREGVGPVRAGCRPVVVANCVRSVVFVNPIIYDNDDLWHSSDCSRMASVSLIAPARAVYWPVLLYYTRLPTCTQQKPEPVWYTHSGYPWGMSREGG